MQRSKTPVKGAAVFVAACVELGPGLQVDHAGRQIAGELLGLGETPLRAAVDKLPATGDARAQVLLLGMVLAALEGRLCGVPRCVHCSQVLTNLGGINVRDGMSHGGSASKRFRSGLRLFRLRCMSWRSKGFGVCSGR